jgi:hypothetical protein
MGLLFLASWLSTRYKQRLLFAFVRLSLHPSLFSYPANTARMCVNTQLFTIPNVVGTIVFMTVAIRPSTKIGLLFAFYCTQGFGAVATLNLAVLAGNVGGRTKQAVANGLVFACVSSLPPFLSLPFLPFRVF